MQVVAPAGSYSALQAAVNSGADAVYLGLPKFGARAKAENFSFDVLRSAVRFAHAYGTKVFVTLNTLIKDGELDQAIESAVAAYECGADAAIVQDIRFIKKLKKKLPDFTLHASTQMGIHNADGAKAVLDMGITRAVLARETLPQDIPEIKKTGIDIEFFVQGALCICFSGNCYFSSLASSYSGNRGKCMQLCRKKYELQGKQGYFLSAKDICLYDRLSYLQSLGVDAIKIEGRMRSDEYVAQAVRIYKSTMPVDKAIDGLKAVYNRGDYCSVYLDKNAPFNVIYSKSQANIGKFIGHIDKVDGVNVSVKGFSPNSGDGFKIMRHGMEIGGASVRNGKISADTKCVCGDELRRTFDGALSKELKSISRKINIDVKIEIAVGKVPAVTVSSENTETLCVTGRSPVQQALSSPVSEEDIRRVFNKTADLPFAPNISVSIDGDCFLPISSLNELRRSAYQKMYDMLSAPPARHIRPEFSLNFNSFDGSGVILAVDDFSVLDDRIVSMADYIAISPKDYNDVDKMRYRFDKPVLLNLPVTMRGEDRKVLERALNCHFVSAVISNNLYGLKLTDKPILLGTGHNIIGDCALPHIRSFEADSVDKNGWNYVFGYAPIMTLCHCPYGKCKNCSGEDYLKDESGRTFNLRRYKIAHCYWNLLNCVPHNLTDIRLEKRYYDCVGLDKKTILSVLNGEYKGEYTRGNINKGLK